MPIRVRGGGGGGGGGGDGVEGLGEGLGVTKKRFYGKLRLGPNPFTLNTIFHRNGNPFLPTTRTLYVYLHCFKTFKQQMTKSRVEKIYFLV